MIAMTRTNIKYLRALLSQHEEDPFPEQMDDVVRAAATERAKQIRRQRIPAKRAAKSPLWLDSLSSASLAVVLTLGSSLLLYHTLTGEPPIGKMATNSEASFELVPEATAPADTWLSVERPIKPQSVELAASNTQPERVAIHYQFDQLTRNHHGIYLD